MIISLLTSCAVLAALTVQSLLLHRLLRQRTVRQAAEREIKSPMDEGFDNIMRYGPGARAGFAPEGWEE